MYVLRESGIRQIFKKGYRNLRRYGFSGSKMRKNIELFTDICRRNDAQGCTLFIPGVIFRREVNFINRFSDTIEIGLHGMQHYRFDECTYDSQLKDLEEGWRILKEAGIDHRYFRAPYGRTNSDTFRALTATNCSLDSSDAYHWKVDGINNPTNRLYENGLKEYNLQKNPLPKLRDSMLEIPMSLPDDEMLVDRLDLSAEQIANIWLQILQEVKSTNHLFVLQLHPNRMTYLSDTLNRLLKNANDNSMWVGSLGRLALMWRRKNAWCFQNGALCISGDVDAMSALEMLR